MRRGWGRTSAPVRRLPRRRPRSPARVAEPPRPLPDSSEANLRPAAGPTLSRRRSFESPAIDGDRFVWYFDAYENVESTDGARRLGAGNAPRGLPAAGRACPGGTSRRADRGAPGHSRSVALVPPQGALACRADRAAPRRPIRLVSRRPERDGRPHRLPHRELLSEQRDLRSGLWPNEGGANRGGRDAGVQTSEVGMTDQSPEGPVGVAQ